MQNSIWKLTALAGVVGIGCLVILQAQRGFQKPGEELAKQIADQNDAAPEDVSGEVKITLAEPAATPPTEAASSDAPPPQSEPEVADVAPPATTAATPPPWAHDTATTATPEQSTAAPEQTAAVPEQPTEPPFAATDPAAAPAEPPAQNPAPAVAVTAVDATTAAPSDDQNQNFESYARDRAATQPPTPIEPAGAPPTAAPEVADAAKPSANFDPFESTNENTAAKTAPATTPPQQNPAVVNAQYEETAPNFVDNNVQTTSNELPATSEPAPSGAGPHLLEPAPEQNLPSTEVRETREGEPPFARSAGIEQKPEPTEPQTDVDPNAFPEETAQPKPPAEPNRFVPDPGAFSAEEASPQPNERKPRSINLLAAEDEESFGLEEEPAPQAQPGQQPQNQNTEPQTDPQPSEDSTMPLLEVPPTTASDEKVEPEHSERAAPVEAATPNPLDPPSDAAEISVENDARLKGDATIEGTPPQGPQRPQITIEKTAPPSAILGQPLIYSIVISNVGNSTAHQVVVEDRIPKGAQLTGTIPRAEMIDKRLIWKLGDIKPGENKKISIRVVPQSEGTIGSVATVNFVSEVASQTLVTSPKVRLELGAPQQVKVGEAVQIRFKVINDGSGEAHGVVVRSILPEQLHHPGGSDLQYEIGTLAAGESKDVQLTMTATKVGDAVNRAVVTADGGLSVEANAPVKVVGTPLVVSRTGPSNQYLGRTAAFTNMITNNSDQPVSGATIVEIVPAGMEFVDATEGGQYNPADRTIAWRIEHLGPRESKVVKVQLRPTSEGAQISLVSGVDSTGTKVETSSQTVVQGFSALSLSVPTIEGPVTVGEPVALKVAARNRGTQSATNVRLTVMIPDALELVSVKGPSQYKQTGPKIEFASVPSIAGQQESEIEVILRARKPGDMRVVVQMQSDQMRQPLNQEEAILVLPPVQ